MNSPLYVIVDISGSMNEMGKIHLQRNLCRYVSQLQIIDQAKYSEVGTRFFQWASEVSEIIIQDDGDIPALTPKGSSDLSFLSDFLSAAMSNVQMLRALILSDGNFTNSDISSFQKRLNTFPNLLLRTVAIGADADLLKLKKMSTSESVYLSENISAAIDSTSFGTDESVIAPASASQIKFTQPAEPEEDWDV